MAKREILRNQLENLFSDIDIPDPQVAQEAAPETVEDTIRRSLEQALPHEAPLPEPVEEPIHIQPAAETEPKLDAPPLWEPAEPEQAGRRLVPHAVRQFIRRWLSSLGRKLILAFLAAAIIPSIMIPLVGVLTQVSRVRANATDNLELLATLQENQIEQWIQSQISALTSLAHEPSLVQQIRTYLLTDQDEDDRQTTRLSVSARLSSFQVQHPVFDEVFLLNADGEVAISTDATHQDQWEDNMPYFSQGREESYYGPPTLSERSNRLNLVVGEPLHYITGEFIGVLVGLVNPEPLSQLVQTAPGLTKTGETYLVNQSGQLITSLQGQEIPAPGKLMRSTGIERAIAEDSGQDTYRNYAGQTVLGVYHWLPSVQMGLLAERKITEAFAPLFAGVGITLAVTLIAVVLTALLAHRMAQRIAQPVVQITAAARQMMAGDLNQPVAIERTDEIGILGQAFNHMAHQLRRTITGLEERVAERTKQLQQANLQYQKRATHLEASASISQAAASILDPQELIQTTVDLIRERFSLYHVSLFLVDETGKWAVVSASTGEVGRQMLSEPHRLRIGDESMVGWACAHGQPRIALDVGADAVHFDNPLLPNTRSEMVVPLRVGDRLLGALDVQSAEEAGFDEDDVQSLQGMADMIAVALENARLFAATRQSARQQQIIARITDPLQRANSVADILTLTLEELGEIFDLAQATVCLGTEAELRAAGNGREHAATPVEVQRAPRGVE